MKNSSAVVRQPGFIKLTLSMQVVPAVYPPGQL